MNRYWIVLALLGVLVAALDLVLLAGFRTPHWAFDVLLWLAAGYITLWWMSRAGLLWRHNQRRQVTPSNGMATGDAEIVSLPMQDKAIDQIKALLMPATVRDGRVVSLKGEWGAGKTVTLRRLQDDLDQEIAQGSGRFVPVWINVWRAETEAELHLAFYEEILHTPVIFRECWLALPWLTPRMSLLLRQLVHSVRVAFKNGDMAMEATLQPDVPLALTVQPQIEWIVNQMRRAGLGVVLILEELDRATPTISKQAIVSVERSFKLPGVTVILPYVQQHLWAKVFNPLDPAPADLDSSMETLLQQDLLQMAKTAAFDAESLTEEVPPPEHLGLYAAKPIPQAQEAQSPRLLDAKAPLAVWWRYRLHRQFALLDEHHRNRLRRRFSEKYLGGYQVELGKYGAGDIAALITHKVSLFTMTQRAFPVLAGNDEDARNAIREAVIAHCKDLKLTRLRHFESFYLRLIERDMTALHKAQDEPPGHEVFRLLAALGLSPDSPKAVELFGDKLPGPDPEWRIKFAVRTVAAFAGMAAWYAQMMMTGDET